jgi:hypothetical protein
VLKSAFQLYLLPQQFLYLSPLPQGQGSFLPTLLSVFLTVFDTDEIWLFALALPSARFSICTFKSIDAVSL